MAIYDKHYKEHNYFGNPYAELMNYFSLSERGKLLDLGAGQGRDSIPLSKMGYDVTAVDISCVGIEQIRESDSSITTVTSDLYSFDVSGYDYILLDSILHFYKQDRIKEIGLLKQILRQMDVGATLVNCLLKNKNSETILKETISQFDVRIVHESYIDYPDFEAVYHLYIINKERLFI